MPVFITLIWNSMPTWVKWIIGIIVLLMWMPLYVRDTAKDFVQQEARASMSEYKTLQDHKNHVMDLKIASLKESVDDTKAYTRAIGIHLMGERKLEEKIKSNP
jgi:hypothetical protein